MFFAISTLYLSIFFYQDVFVGGLINISRSLIRMSGWIVGFWYICKSGDYVTESFQEIGDSIQNAHGMKCR